MNNLSKNANNSNLGNYLSDNNLNKNFKEINKLSIEKTPIFSKHRNIQNEKIKGRLFFILIINKIMRILIFIYFN